MIRYFLGFIFLMLSYAPRLIAQTAPSNQTLHLTMEQIEALFLSRNLELIAERMNVDMADAAIAQAKLWENPSLSIGDVSFWSSRGQRDGESEAIPPLFGTFGRNTQFSVELSQMIQTAGKRRKLVRVEQASKEVALRQFEEVLRGLKIELRSSVYQIVYLTSYRRVLAVQTEYIVGIIRTYARQVEEGNLTKGELLRLQAMHLEIENEFNEISTELNGQMKTLKILLNADPALFIEITDDEQPGLSPAALSLPALIDTGLSERPDIRMQQSNSIYYDRTLAYEKSLRAPDLNVSVGYDRWGGVWKNFVGIGIGVDIPLFNRNQGNIRAARIGRRQSDTLLRQQQQAATHEIVQAFENYVLAYGFYDRLKDNPLLKELEGMFEVYTKNLLSRNISLIEFIDGFDTYKNNKNMMLMARRNLNLQFEELQNAVGTEIKTIKQ